jgi:elongation factor G
MSSYAIDLRQITAGRGEYLMEPARYEQVPASVAGKVVDEARQGASVKT